MFPDARILRMDRDTTSTKEGHFKILKEFSEHNADILVGTQMIAKGHDFPKVTLVGILDADMSLHFSDFRSGERTFQLITQVAGRSGRAEEKGKVVLQTYTPENFILRQAVRYDYEKMYEHEISVRKATGFPPFTDIVRVIVSAEDEDLSVNTTREVYNKISDLRTENNGVFRFLACMKAPIKKIQNKFRYQVIMRLTSNRQDLIDKINEICDMYNNKVTGVYVEINPNNLS
jgi:primosomal protein N' (replication factor Y)